MARLGTILHHGTQLVENVQTLIDLALGIGRIWTLLRRCGLSGNACVAGVHRAAIAITATVRTGCSAGNAVANRTRLTSRLPAATALSATALASLLSLALLPGLATLRLLLTALAASALSALSLLALSLSLTLSLASLRGLRVAVQLAGLSLTLLASALATLARLSIGLASQSRELIPQARQIVHCAGERGIL